MESKASSTADGYDRGCKRKRGGKDDSKVLAQRNWKDRVTINQDEDDWQKLAVGNQEMNFRYLILEMCIDVPLGSRVDTQVSSSGKVLS